MKVNPMARYRSYSIKFKRQVAQEFLGGESLNGLARRHNVCAPLRTPCGSRPAHRRGQRPAVEIRDAVPTLSNGHPLAFLAALGKPVNDMAKSGLLGHRHVGRSPV